jgi:hypothetical protein
VLDLSTAEEACDKTLDLLGSDPNDERVKGRSNKLLLTGCCEDIHRVNLLLYACGAMQLPPYQLLGSLEEFWMDT